MNFLQPTSKPNPRFTRCETHPLHHTQGNGYVSYQHKASRDGDGQFYDDDTSPLLYKSLFFTYGCLPTIVQGLRISPQDTTQWTSYRTPHRGHHTGHHTTDITLPDFNCCAIFLRWRTHARTITPTRIGTIHTPLIKLDKIPWLAIVMSVTPSSHTPYVICKIKVTRVRNGLMWTFMSSPVDCRCIGVSWVRRASELFDLFHKL